MFTETNKSLFLGKFGLTLKFSYFDIESENHSYDSAI